MKNNSYNKKIDGDEVFTQPKNNQVAKENKYPNWKRNETQQNCHIGQVRNQEEIVGKLIKFFMQEAN